jgi:hypothetical protein
MTQPQPASGQGGAKLRPDDEIYRNNRSYLGPSGYTLPFRIPYRAMPVFAAVFLPGLLVLRIMGASGLALYAVDFLVSCALAAVVVRFTGPERPISALLTIFIHEISAPRPRRRPPEQVAVTLRPSLVPLRPLPQPRQSRRTTGRRGET